MPPRLGTLSRWGRTSDAGGAGGGEGGKEASNRGRGTREKGRRRVSVMVYSGEHNSLAHRSMVGNYCKFIRAARFHLPPPLSPPYPAPLVSPSLALLHPTRSPSSILTRLPPRSEEVTAIPPPESENPFSRSWNCDIPRETPKLFDSVICDCSLLCG